MNSNTNLPIEDQIEKLRLKCLMDLVELAKLDKDWNPEDMAQAFGEIEQ